jgi:hypothetical protein
MKKNLIIASLAVTMVPGATVLTAQVEPAPYITVHYDTVDPSMMMAYEENGKEWVEAFTAAEAGEDHYWRAYQSGFTYAWVSDMPNYAYIDSQGERGEAIGEKIGEDRMAELEGGAAGAILDHHTEIWKYEADMSYMPEGFNPAEMGAITVSIDKIKSGKGEEFRDLVKEAIAAMKKIEAPINFFAYSIPFGEGSYAWVSWGEDRAALHAGPESGELLAKAVGPERAEEMFGQFLGTVASSEEDDWKVRRDLSYVGAEASQEESMKEAAE